MAKDRTTRRTAPSEDPQEQFANRADRFMIWAEDALYVLTAAALGIGAFIVIGKAMYDFVTLAHDGVTEAIDASFATLLIVFILVELLTAVRVAVAEHELVAEPFLLVGILAAIKELVALSTFDLEKTKDPPETVLKIGALAGVILVLAAATWILRRREREPEETEETDEGPPKQEGEEQPAK